MKLALLLGIGLLCAEGACPPCGCRSFLQRRQVPTLGGGHVDPLATEAAAAPVASAAGPPGSATVEMVSTNPEFLRVASDATALQELVASKLAIILGVGVGRFEVVPVNDGTAAAGGNASNATVFLQESNVSAVMWVLHINPLPAPPASLLNATNATNATLAGPVIVCPPCPCMNATDPSAPVPVPGLTPPAEPSSEALGAELVLQARQPGSRLAVVLPMTNVRAPGGLFASPSRTSVAIGSRPMKGGLPLQAQQSDQAMRVNEHTLQQIAQLKKQLHAANEQRAYILTHGMAAPAVDGKLPLPVAETDPWSSMTDDSMLGRHER